LHEKRETENEIPLLQGPFVRQQNHRWKQNLILKRSKNIKNMFIDLDKETNLHERVLPTLKKMK